MGRNKQMKDRGQWTHRILIVCTLMVILLMTFLLRYISYNFYQQMQIQRGRELKKLVEVAYNAIYPFVELAESGDITKEEALTRIQETVRKMTYSDEFGPNYIFASAYDGTMLVQPFEPEKEGTNQWDLKDAKGQFIIRKIVNAVKEAPEGSFVTYYYFPPGKQEMEEKMSYLKGIPALGIFIGTGMYLESGYIEMNRLMTLQKEALVISAATIIILIGIYIWQLLDSRRRLIMEIGERRYVEQVLSHEKKLMSVTLQSIGDAVIATDEKGRVTLINRVAEELTGWRQEEGKGRPLTQVFKIVNEKTRQPCENPVEKVLNTGRTVGLANHTALIAKDGREIPIADSAAPIKDDTGQVFGVVLVFRDVTEHKKKQDEIVYLSYHDALTGLYNRRFMEEEIRRLDTKRQLPIALIMGDVNGLKLANDVFGHDTGDTMLKKAAEVIKESCRQEDIISRWGGDEFVLLMPQTGKEGVEAICKRIRENCEKNYSHFVPLSIAIGYAVKTEPEESIWKVLKEAEDWMYHNKLLQARSYRSVSVESLKKTLFEKSVETEKHAERLKEMCHKIGEHLGLSSIELNELDLLAVLHDIGKVAINEGVLTKPGDLDKNEWDEIKRHPEIGYRIAQSIPELSKIAEYILSHHEHWDGKGYPRGLKGEGIPLLSRILAVADAYDAMTNDRLYRKAISRDEAIQEIRNNAGTQFDPEVVKAFLEIC